MAKHRAVSPVGTALLAGVAPLALIALLAPLAGCGSDEAAAPVSSATAPAAANSAVPTAVPTAVPSALPTVVPTPTPTPPPLPTLEPVGPAYLSVITGSEIIMDDGCFDY
ncbi:MAG: hypothetical protein ACKOW5_14350, partial [Actinomycetales bacterium]